MFQQQDSESEDEQSNTDRGEFRRVERHLSNHQYPVPTPSSRLASEDSLEEGSGTVGGGVILIPLPPDSLIDSSGAMAAVQIQPQLISQRRLSIIQQHRSRENVSATVEIGRYPPSASASLPMVMSGPGLVQRQSLSRPQLLVQPPGQSQSQVPSPGSSATSPSRSESSGSNLTFIGPFGKKQKVLHEQANAGDPEALADPEDQIEYASSTSDKDQTPSVEAGGGPSQQSQSSVSSSKKLLARKSTSSSAGPSPAKKYSPSGSCGYYHYSHPQFNPEGPHRVDEPLNLAISSDDNAPNPCNLTTPPIAHPTRGRPPQQGRGKAKGKGGNNSRKRSTSPFLGREGHSQRGPYDDRAVPAAAGTPGQQPTMQVRPPARKPGRPTNASYIAEAMAIAVHNIQSSANSSDGSSPGGRGRSRSLRSGSGGSPTPRYRPVGTGSESSNKSDKVKKKYVCCDCGKEFSQLRNYRYHRSRHEGTTLFACTCPVCGKSFNDKGYLSSHLKIHANAKEYQCEFCEKGFNQRVAYNMHVRIHTGHKPHACHLCPKKFSRKMLLRQHIRTHTGERPYVCSVCQKTFADRSNMLLHQRLHTGDRPYKCGTCGKTFSKNHHLKTHMNHHLGIRPYTCHKCLACFSQSSNMKTHLKKCNGNGKGNPDGGDEPVPSVAAASEAAPGPSISRNLNIVTQPVTYLPYSGGIVSGSSTDDIMEVPIDCQMNPFAQYSSLSGNASSQSHRSDYPRRRSVSASSSAIGRPTTKPSPGRVSRGQGFTPPRLGRPPRIPPSATVTSGSYIPGEPLPIAAASIMYPPRDVSGQSILEDVTSRGYHHQHLHPTSGHMPSHSRGRSPNRISIPTQGRTTSVIQQPVPQISLPPTLGGISKHEFSHRQTHLSLLAQQADPRHTQQDHPSQHQQLSLQQTQYYVNQFQHPQQQIPSSGQGHPRQSSHRSPVQPNINPLLLSPIQIAGAGSATLSLPLSSQQQQQIQLPLYYPSQQYSPPRGTQSASPTYHRIPLVSSTSPPATSRSLPFGYSSPEAPGRAQPPHLAAVSGFSATLQQQLFLQHQQQQQPHQQRHDPALLQQQHHHHQPLHQQHQQMHQQHTPPLQLIPNPSRLTPHHRASQQQRSPSQPQISPQHSRSMLSPIEQQHHHILEQQIHHEFQSLSPLDKHRMHQIILQQLQRQRQSQQQQPREENQDGDE